MPAFTSANADVPSEELSEEDQQLKSELEMLMERLDVRLGPSLWWSSTYLYYYRMTSHKSYGTQH